MLFLKILVTLDKIHSVLNIYSVTAICEYLTTRKCLFFFSYFCDLFLTLNKILQYYQASIQFSIEEIIYSCL